MSSTGVRREERRAGERVSWPAWVVACLAIPAVLQLTTVNYWPRFPSPNERARAYQALAIVTRGALSIDPELDHYGAMEDVAVHAGRHYPNKAPGLLPLLVPAAAVAHAVAGEDGEISLRMTLVLGRLLCSGLPFLATILLLADRLVPRYPRGGPVVVAVYALATPALTASLLLFAHAVTAFLVLAAAALLCAERPTPLAAGVAGSLLAWAACCEYQLAVPAVILVALAFSRLRWRGAGLAAVGAVAPLALLALYDAACFGSPWTLSSAHEASASLVTLASRGLFGISLPSPAGLAYMLFSPARGLLVWVPLAALAAGALFARAENARTVTPLAAAVALIVLMAGYPNRHGGWFPGPRYLLGVLPLLLWSAAGPLDRLLSRTAGRVVVAVLALWGWIALWPITAAFPFPPTDEPVPSLTLAPHLLAQGALFPSWLPSGPSAALWLLLGLAAGSTLLIVAQSGSMERWLSLALVTALAAATSLAPRPSSWPARLARAVLHDVYAGLEPGELEALRAASGSPGRRAAVDWWLARRDGPR